MHQKRIYGLAYRYMANREDAEDVVQEVLLRLWNHISRIDGEYMEAWISRGTLEANLLQHIGIGDALSRLENPY